MTRLRGLGGSKLCIASEGRTLNCARCVCEVAFLPFMLASSWRTGSVRKLVSNLVQTSYMTPTYIHLLLCFWPPLQGIFAASPPVCLSASYHVV